MGSINLYEEFSSDTPCTSSIYTMETSEKKVNALYDIKTLYCLKNFQKETRQWRLKYQTTKIV